MEIKKKYIAEQFWKRNQKRTLEISWNNWQWKHNMPKSIRYGKSSSKREVYRNKMSTLRKNEIYRILIQNLNLYINKLEKRRMN